MKYITSTELRTKAPELIETLKNGNSVSLVYRSKIIAKVEPVDYEYKDIPRQPAKKFSDFVREMAPATSIGVKEMRKVYHNHLMKKYGKGISGR